MIINKNNQFKNKINEQLYSYILQDIIFIDDQDWE